MKSWEPEEDDTLKMALLEIGPRWKEIAKRLPGRTEAMCRNRRQRMEAARRAGATARNRCLVCGEMKKGHTCQRRAELNALGYQRGGPQTLSGASTTPSAVSDDAADMGVASEDTPPMVRRITTDDAIGALDAAMAAGRGAEPIRADDVAMADLEAVELRTGAQQPQEAAPPMVRRGADVPLGSFCSFGSVSVDLTWRGWQAGESAGTNTVALQELAAAEAACPARPSDSVAEAFAREATSEAGRAGTKRAHDEADESAMLDELVLLDSKRHRSDGDRTAPTAPNTAPSSPTVNGVPVDTTGDGLMDSVAVDTSRDGCPDAIARCAPGILVDTTGDGLVDSLAIDTTRDGQVDTIVSIADAASARLQQSAQQQQLLRRLVEAKQHERQQEQPQGESSAVSAIDMGVLLEEADRRVSIDCS